MVLSSSVWVVGCGGSRVEDRGGSAGLEFWVLWVFFFFFGCDRCLKEEVGMVELGMAFCYSFDLNKGWIFFLWVLSGGVGGCRGGSGRGWGFYYGSYVGSWW